MRAAFFIVFVSVLGLLTPISTVAQPADDGMVALSDEQARSLALQALRTRNFPVADAVSSAILNQNPNDADMLMVRAVLAREAGDLEAAREAAARAYANSDNPNLRFDAAIMTGDLYAREEKYLRSEFWLRRADQSATSPQQQQITENFFRRVRQLNPLTVQLRFTVRPSNNVNNGAETLEIDIGGLPFRLDESGQQLGGYEASAGVSLAYRLSESQTHRTELLADLFYRKVWLDDDAKALSPTSENSDFDYRAVVVGLNHTRLIWPDLGPTSLGVLFGRSWYGENRSFTTTETVINPLTLEPEERTTTTDLTLADTRWFELSGRQAVRLDERRSLSFGARARSENRLDAPVNDNTQLALSVDYRQAAETSGSWGLGATFRNVWSDSATSDRFSTELRADRAFGQIGPMVPRIRVSLENQNFHEFTTTIDGRQDRSVTLDLNARFPDVRFYGFIPEASIRARKTDSNVDIYDRNEYSFGITAVSRF